MDLELPMEVPASNSCITSEDLEIVEGILLNLPQVACEVTNYFGPGIYIREVTIPAGTLVIGHEHRCANLNILLHGSISLLTSEGVVQTLQAPYMFIGQPGRKTAYVVSDAVFLNIYPNPTNETDPDKLDDMFVEKSQTFKTHERREV